ncbi:MAG TPA: thiolase domain-containing protein [Polyangia bacterium]|nr:thiolase domain-containing protein [Polyangia bacterium]
MRPVAIVSFAQTPFVRRTRLNDAELVMEVVTAALERARLPRHEIGFCCSGSSDFLTGAPFSFVGALDAVGAWPPIQESHVEMDGAWALYEAWVRLQHGDLDTALVYAFGRSSLGDLQDVLVQQLDPYYLAPLGADPIGLAALQARALLDGGEFTERDFAEVAAQNRARAQSNRHAQVRGSRPAGALLDEPYLAAPLRKHDCPPISDGAAAIVLAAGDRARALCERPAWIAGIDHRIEPHALGARDLTRSPSTERAAREANAHERPIDVAELHAPFSPQELILRRALALPGSTAINPSGGALAANPIMVAGLVRLGEAAARVIDGVAARALGHATSGPCLQQNLVCVLEARP